MFLLYVVTWPYARVKATGGDVKWQGRLGLIPETNCDIWIHASSVGEVKVISHLIRYLKESRPSVRIHLTAMTEQGVKTAESILSDPTTISYFPLDTGAVIKRTLNKLNPSVIVIAETEIWPSLILRAKGREIPLVLVNGRMSPGGFKQYKRFSQATKQLLACYDRLFFKSETDRDLFAQLGVASEMSTVAGDMKFDAPLLHYSAEELAVVRKHLGVAENDFLFVAGSTRPGEEQLLLDAFNNAETRPGRLRLVVAPRHLERLDEIKTLLRTTNTAFSLYGGGDTTGVILVERMGILNELYAAADLAFVGGTLVDLGGHNIIEPVWAGTPVIFGPHTANVSEAVDYIMYHHYGQQIDSADNLASVLQQVVTGELSFTRKEEFDLESSATSIAGRYILERLNNA